MPTPGDPVAAALAAAYSRAPFPSAQARTRAEGALQILMGLHDDVRLHREPDGSVYLVPIEPAVCTLPHGGDMTIMTTGEAVHFEELECCLPSNTWIDKAD